MPLLNIPSGEQGTRAVLLKMRELTNKDTANQSIIEFTNDLVSDLPERNQKEEAKRIFEFVRDKIRYVKDPFRVETVYSASKTLDPVKTEDGWNLAGRMQADCDCKSVVAATMLQSIGMPTRFVAIKTPFKPTGFSHVYLEALINREWIPMETILKKPFGWEYKLPLEKLYLDNTTGNIVKKAGFLSGLGEPLLIIDGLGMLMSNVDYIEDYKGNRLADIRTDLTKTLSNPLVIISLIIMGFALIPKLFVKKRR